ncbi:MAG: sel1 repeat family protein [Chromatiales bacterium]|nr:sel1 repeat family protein [Chromatiales bacterium]
MQTFACARTYTRTNDTSQQPAGYCRPLSWVFGVLLYWGSAVPAQAGACENTGVAAWRSGQHEKATSIWLARAQAGDAESQRFLSYAYSRGLGVQKDPKQSVHWLRAAAEQGQVDAQYELGLLHELGIGVRRDYAEAQYWYGLVVDQGFCPGMTDFAGPLKD